MQHKWVAAIVHGWVCCRETELDADAEYDVDAGLDLYESRNKRTNQVSLAHECIPACPEALWRALELNRSDSMLQLQCALQPFDSASSLSRLHACICADSSNVNLSACTVTLL